MAKKGSAALAIVAAVAVIAAGVAERVPATDTAIRAVLAAGAGGLIGWLVFGLFAGSMDVNKRD
jgi:hypothetical protein